ncbi:unnamed protein product [Bemisia tabaci]|uniref:Partial AB-hydrolase lipase domain-containing protein n=1 Tax=Bemisia tabaci TaxID=7038 RepID=A0A9P0F2I3_BEMTA|nr:unnamed protein product [Bemisia tabaci]
MTAFRFPAKMTAFRFPAKMTAFRFPAPVIVIVLVCLGSAEELSDMATMTTDEFIRYYGYKAETHDVTTEDGYILQLHRIVKEGGPPVIFQHGLLGASDSWVLRGPKSDLSFMLADEGYDIWLPDCRGNMYSQRHVNLTTADAAFWDFSWHEMGYYDMPAVVDHILNVTSYKNLVYLGHSMGTTMFYVFASTRPEYNEKIALSFQPGAYRLCFSHVPRRHHQTPRQQCQEYRANVPETRYYGDTAPEELVE